LALHVLRQERLRRGDAVLHDTCAMSRSVPTSKVTVSEYEPSLALTDDM
jgi:hypothetical protein